MSQTENSVSLSSQSTSVIWKHDLFIPKCEAFTDEHTKLEPDNIEDPLNNSTSNTSMNQGSPSCSFTENLKLERTKPQPNLEPPMVSISQETGKCSW